ncbi:hypothetical protein SAMN05216345_108201 [Cupriavidus sp. YR651]|uniref:hypothetical protein n=1 Tax=Cupriavidus sp. YR651 TaxID=1855315 RepID=UPI00088BE7E1|nr:hypothetical protein [Cupriavidus sp. YR651]SDD38701.1 hypothetical protein SAMN05216345_108201 [Cupriavidus sp. YR651]
MRSPASVDAGLRLCEMRIVANERRRWRLERQSRELHARHAQLASERDLLAQMERVTVLDGNTVDRSALFGWLRRRAMAVHRTQALRVEIGESEEKLRACAAETRAMQARIDMLGRKHDRYSDRKLSILRWQHIARMNRDEADIEERVAWNR